MACLSVLALVLRSTAVDTGTAPTKFHKAKLWDTSQTQHHPSSHFSPNINVDTLCSAAQHVFNHITTTASHHKLQPTHPHGAVQHSAPGLTDPHNACISPMWHSHHTTPTVLCKHRDAGSRAAGHWSACHGRAIGQCATIGQAPMCHPTPQYGQHFTACTAQHVPTACHVTAANNTVTAMYTYLRAIAQH